MSFAGGNSVLVHQWVTQQKKWKTKEMDMTEQVTSKSIDGITDLVVWAPIKEGFIDAFENVTYETRLRLVAEALHAVRKSAREHELISPFPDTAERILTLLDFRIGIVDKDLFELEASTGVKPRKYMYLVATFDGPWEPYMRLIWDPLGEFLDLVLCNCEGYPSAVDNSFEKYAKWVREHQLDSAIFYSTTGLTVKDQRYLQKLEKYQREIEDGVTRDDRIARMTSDDPDELSSATRKVHPRETARLALEALTVFYKLAEFYPPDRLQGDGRFLLRAAKKLLAGWNSKKLPPAVRSLYSDPLNWFELEAPCSRRPQSPDPGADDSEVQKGLLSDYNIDGTPVTHGALLLLQVTDAAKARNFLRRFPFSWEQPKPNDKPAEELGFGSVFRNIAFTYHGLERLGLTAAELAVFPKEFQEGMEERAPILGDSSENHPRRWRLPARNWPRGDDSNRPPVELHEVDFILQFRTVEFQEKNIDYDIIEFDRASSELFESIEEEFQENLAQKSPTAKGTQTNTGEGEGPIALYRQIDTLLSSRKSQSRVIERLITLIGLAGPQFGFALLSIENMIRQGANRVADDKLANDPKAPATTDHFGFRDGISQPTIEKNPTREGEVRRGDILCGYQNMRGDYASNDNTGLFLNSSFLALRKMSQDVAAFKEFVQDNGDDCAFRLVGRDFDGKPLNGKTDNYFRYDEDQPSKEGENIPLACHIRRANPRNEFHNRKSPRILRRGMTYGKRHETAPNDMRGVVFMAYNASLAEQFEVIQSWVNGGNSTGVSSSQVDPFVGINPSGLPHTFRFLMDGKVRRVEIKKPFARIEWGGYFFVPSRTALEKICDSRKASTTREDKGDKLIQRIEALPSAEQRREWKVLLEDFLTKDPSERGASINVWEAIRKRYGGAYRLKEGVEGRTQEESKQQVVLIADEALTLKVLSNNDAFSVSEQGMRADQSFGSIYVAQDPGDRYYKESKETNEIIYAIGEEAAFNIAYRHSELVLKNLQASALGNPFVKFEIRRQYIMPALGSICSFWFGVPDGEYVKNAGWGWGGIDDGSARCPGDYMAPSRFIFYPRPTTAIADYGKSHGIRLKRAIDQLVAQSRKKDLDGLITRRMFQVISDNDLLARNLIGIMTGALPPIDGNLRAVLFEWLNEKTLWRHQGAYHRSRETSASAYAAANASLRGPIMSAMSKRPAPDLIFRTATKNFILNHGNSGIEFRERDLVILALVSSTQRRVHSNEHPNVDIVFGGRRRGVEQPADEPVHACPAYKMAMGTMTGIVCALLDAGQIEALPASLIIKISDWKTS